MNAHSESGQVLEPAMIEELRDNLTPAMRRELVDAFRAQVDRTLGELTAAIREGDRAQCSRLAHGLKGSSASMGASRMQFLCDRLAHPEAHADAGSADAQLEELQQVSAESVRAVAEALS
jgi:HPt (histidine-containing phosphotransfer) domain-containing protein